MPCAQLITGGKFACFGVYATVDTPGDLAVGDVAQAKAAVS